MMRLKNDKLNLMIFLALLAGALIMGLAGCGGGGGGGGAAPEPEPGDDTTPPENVTNLEATPGDTQIALAWTASADTEGDLAGYKVYVNNAEVADLAADATSYAATGLTNGTAYAVKVTAYDEVPNENTGATANSYANAPLGAADFDADSGLADGAAVTGATQTMRGAVPNPGGGATYAGEAFLVINGSQIPLNVTAGNADQLSRTIYKEGKTYEAKGHSINDPEFAFLPKADDQQWIFEVTFSVNAGPNTIQIQVYDLDGSLYAATDQWTVIGAIEPTSMVVTLWWDTNLTDIDLHVSPDDGATHCYYSNMAAGDMQLDYDDTNGYGPEHVTIANATESGTYAIKVYYYADHNNNEDGSTTPTTCYINAQVNGETKLDASSTLSDESSSSGWGGGAHVWDAGEVEVVAANRLNVTLGEPDLSAYPEVTIPVTILNPADDNAGVEDLGDTNIYVINAGMAMDPVTVVDNGGGSYDLTYEDITAGKRNVFVYVWAPVEEEAADADARSGEGGFMGGLSDTITYGTNYALLVGLNEYPAAACSITGNGNVDATTYRVDVKPTPPAGTVNIAAAEFTITVSDAQGVRPTVSPAATGIASQGAGVYRLTFTKPANWADYDNIVVKYEKEAWLSNSVNDILDIEALLQQTGTGTANNMWEAGNIQKIQDAAATKAAVLGAIETTANAMEPYDLFLFHYSGHGADGNTDATQYLCTYEDNAWTSETALKAKLDLIPSGGIVNTFVFLDACFSGNFVDKGMGADETVIPVGAIEKYRDFLPQSEEDAVFGGSFKDMAKDISGDNIFVITAVDGAHSAWDVNALQNGVFTYYLVEGLTVNGIAVSAAPANANHDSWVTGEEAFNYTEPLSKQYVIDNIVPQDAGAAEEAQYGPSIDGTSRLIYNW